MIEVIAMLTLLMVAGALVAVETPNLLSSVISVGAVGFLLAIAFLFLGAPDIAIVQIGVEVISLVILIRATIGRDVEPAVGHREFVGVVAAVTLVAGIGIFGIRAFADFPAFGRSVMERIADAPSNTYLQDGLASTGAPNIVTAVLLDFRAYDTLGEATVLFCAVLGALTILRRKARAEPARDEAEADPR
jgi:multisubunit Na+/H+ antiporter MnhB subunit